MCTKTLSAWNLASGPSGGAADAREDMNCLEFTQIEKPEHLIETAAGRDNAHAGGGNKDLNVCTSQSYGVAAAYELISHASEISSKSGLTHSMGMPPFLRG